MIPIAAIIDDLAGRRAAQDVLTVDGVAVTGATLDALARRHAARLLSLGIGRGDRVAFQAATSPELIAALLAQLRLGVVHVPLNTRYRAEEVAHVLGDSGAAHLAGLAGLAHLADPAAGLAAQAPLATWPAPASDASPDALGLIIYTSGTTGRPKGVMLSQRALDANLGAMMALWEIGAGDVVSHALPLFHVHGLGLGLLGPLAAGASLRLHGKFSAAALVSDCARDASVVMAVPTMYHALMEHLAVRPDDGPVLGRARLFTAGSAALSATLMEGFEAATGRVILERYGMTETLFTLSNPLDGERRPGTVGLPVPGVAVRLVDDDGTVITDDAGELEVRGPGLMDGYWGRPEDTEKSYHDGWFRTGDVARVERDGYYRIVGRRSTDIIKSGGFKIGAREIEDVLARHPRVAEVAVLGLPDERWGELVAAAVVPVGDAAGLDAELAAWCAEHLADFKRPRRMVFLSALPRNAMGKVVKPELRGAF